MRSTMLSWLLLFGILAISIIFTLTPNRFFQVFQRPDTALAWVGLALVTVLVLRDLAKQRIRGIIAILFRIKKMEDVTEYMSKGWRGVIVRGGYWIAVGLLAFASANLIIGTITDIKSYDTPAIEQLVDSNRELIDRLDKLIEIMEANNDTSK